MYKLGVLRVRPPVAASSTRACRAPRRTPRRWRRPSRASSATSTSSSTPARAPPPHAGERRGAPVLATGGAAAEAGEARVACCVCVCIRAWYGMCWRPSTVCPALWREWRLSWIRASLAVTTQVTWSCLHALTSGRADWMMGPSGLCVVTKLQRRVVSVDLDRVCTEGRVCAVVLCCWQVPEWR